MLETPTDVRPFSEIRFGAQKKGERREKRGGGSISGPSLLAFRWQVRTPPAVLVRVGYMSKACALCPTRGIATAGKWFVCPGFAGRPPPPIAVCETCADVGFASSAGLRSPSGAAHFRRRICSALVSAKHRGAAVEGFKNRRDPLFARKHIFVVCLWMDDPRRAPPLELRNALLRARKHLPPANTSG